MVSAVTPYSGHRLPVTMWVEGYEQALQRFLGAALDPDATFYALFEALNWATPLDEIIGQLWQPAGESELRRWRQRAPGAAVLDGVRFVRNRVHHQWADALVLEPALEAPMSAPLRGAVWAWIEADALPEPDKRPDQHGRDVYAERLAGKRAEETLLALSEVFGQIGRLLEAPRSSEAGR